MQTLFTPQTVIKLFKLAALFAATLFAATYFTTALPRVLYPYDLDFIEDGILMTALRVANNQPVFVPPNAEFVPHVYMPLYAWLGGQLFKATGVSFLVLRLLSLAATITTAGLIFFIARRESQSAWTGVICAGLFFGGYQITGFWYELARVDSLFVTLALAGLTAGIYARHSNLGVVGAALGLGLATLTKQTGLILGVGLGIYLIIAVRHRAWAYWPAFGLMTCLPVIALQLGSDGWFLYYTVHIAGINPITLGRILNFLTVELFGIMGPLSLMMLGATLLTVRAAGPGGIVRQPWILAIGPAIFISGMGRASIGGNLNNRMMAYTLLCLAPALLTRSIAHTPWITPRWSQGVIAGIVLIQFAIGAYNPWRAIPSLQMRRSGDHLIETIAATGGEVLVMMHPTYARLAKKEPSAQIAAMWHARERGNLPLPPDFATRLEQRYYVLIISDNSLFETGPELQALLAGHYTVAKILNPNEAPPTNTGMVVRPIIFYKPKRVE